VQAGEITARSDLYSLGAVMYELLTGFRPFRGGTLAKLLQQIVNANPAPAAQLRPGFPVELEGVLATALRKDPERRHATGAEFAAALGKVHAHLRAGSDKLEGQERFALLRKLSFFHEFSTAEIWEVLRAAGWNQFAAGDEIVREGATDDRFYVIVSGSCTVQRNGRVIGRLDTGSCFGETSFVRGARRQASILAETPATILQVSSTLLEQASQACQLRFNRVFLRSLIARLQGGES
jgi:eukaryotic-like serine/threonine-protein kinase